MLLAIVKSFQGFSMALATTRRNVILTYAFGRTEDFRFDRSGLDGLVAIDGLLFSEPALPGGKVGGGSAGATLAVRH
jgi:hypothetical protein